MSQRILLSSLLALLCTLFIPVAAHATYTNCSSSQVPWAATVIDNVPSSLPLGSPISGSDVSTSITINCSSNWSVGEGTTCAGGHSNWAIHTIAATVTTAYPDVYRTSTMPTGIGFQFLDAAGKPFPLDTSNRHNTGVGIRTGNQTVPVRFRLVKVGSTVSSGTVAFSAGLGCNSNEYANKTDAGSRINLSLQTRVITQTCTLPVSDLQVALPMVAANAFQGVGSTAGSKSSSLAFRCDANADARFNLADAADQSNVGTALKLVAGSTASGVGVSLSIAGSPVKLAPYGQFNQGGSEVALRNTGTAVAVQEVPLTAGYVQTGAAVTTGTVQARALINISYN